MESLMSHSFLPNSDEKYGPATYHRMGPSFGEARDEASRDQPREPQTITVHDWHGTPFTGQIASGGRKIYVASELDRGAFVPLH